MAYKGNASTVIATDFYVDASNGTDDASHGTASGSDAWATIQYAIDSLPKYLSNEVTIHVADDTYNISSSIVIEGFYGPATSANGLNGVNGGGLIILGNNAATPSSGNYHIETGANNINGFTVSRNAINVVIKGLYIDSDTQNNKGIKCIATNFVWIQNCRIHNFSTGVDVEASNAMLQVYDVDDNDYGLSILRGSMVCSRTGSSSTTNDVNGMYVAGGGMVFKYGTQPTGAGADEATLDGGQIF